MGQAANTIFDFADGGSFLCRRCQGRHRPSFPVEIPTFVRLAKAFDALHAECPPLPPPMPLFDRLEGPPAIEQGKAPEYTVPTPRGVDRWREMPLSRFLPAKLAKHLDDAHGITTVGHIRDCLADGDPLDVIFARDLTPEEIETLRKGVLRYRYEGGGEILAELPEAWLLDRGEPAPEPTPAKPPKALTRHQRVKAAKVSKDAEAKP